MIRAGKKKETNLLIATDIQLSKSERLDESVLTLAKGSNNKTTIPEGSALVNSDWFYSS